MNAIDPGLFRNLVLRHLDPQVIARLNLKYVSLPARRALEQSDKGIENLFFIESGVGSMTTTFHNGAQVEVGLFGFESVIGVSALMASAAA